MGRDGSKRREEGDLEARKREGRQAGGRSIGESGRLETKGIWPIGNERGKEWGGAGRPPWSEGGEAPAEGRVPAGWAAFPSRADRGKGHPMCMIGAGAGTRVLRREGGRRYERRSTRKSCPFDWIGPTGVVGATRSILDEGGFAVSKPNGTPASRPPVGRPGQTGALGRRRCTTRLSRPVANAPQGKFWG